MTSMSHGALDPIAWASMEIIGRFGPRGPTIVGTRDRDMTDRTDAIREHLRSGNICDGMRSLRFAREIATTSP
jgi:hypothetical protein